MAQLKDRFAEMKIGPSHNNFVELREWQVEKPT